MTERWECVFKIFNKFKRLAQQNDLSDRFAGTDISHFRSL